MWHLDRFLVPYPFPCKFMALKFQLVNTKVAYTSLESIPYTLYHNWHQLQLYAFVYTTTSLAEIGNIKKKLWWMTVGAIGFIWGILVWIFLMKFLGHWDRVKVHAHEKSLKHICIDQSWIFGYKLWGIFSKIKTWRFCEAQHLKCCYSPNST